MSEERSMACRIVWPRACPAALAAFDPTTKVCTMNCGPHASDPRSEKERRLLCDDCLTVNVRQAHVDRSS